jgi:hypothetical protein
MKVNLSTFAIVPSSIVIAIDRLSMHFKSFYVCFQFRPNEQTHHVSLTYPSR